MPKYEITFHNKHPIPHLVGKTLELFPISWDDANKENFTRNGSCWERDPKGKFFGYVDPLTKGVTRQYSNEDTVSIKDISTDVSVGPAIDKPTLGVIFNN